MKKRLKDLVSWSCFQDWMGFAIFRNASLGGQLHNRNSLGRYSKLGIQCTSVLHNTVHICITQYSVYLYYTIQHIAVLHNTVHLCIAQYSILLYCTIQHIAALHNAAYCCIAQYSVYLYHNYTSVLHNTMIHCIDQ